MRGVIILAISLVLPWGVSAQEDAGKLAAEDEKLTRVDAEKLFENRILPLFEKHCFECHGGGETIRGSFILTNRDDLIAGGDSGEAVDLESPHESILLAAVNYEDYEMPPSGKLPRADIDAIRKWLEAGAPWKGKQFKPEHANESMEPEVNEQTRQWWAYQKPTRPAVPDSNEDWSTNAIDRFVFARLKEAGGKPNSMATRTQLVRRLYYDLIGLPPTKEQVDAFVNSSDPNAYENLVDQLLASPHYGEKWGRHWLDLVRYAESNSYERDGTKPFVWRYRDYVIRSLNENKPYDQFVREQLAGDEMPGQKPEQIIATGFYRLGKWDDEPVDRLQAWYDEMDDVLATTSQAFLGMTVDCARCHDHKIDPIPQADYYRMLAFFRNVQSYGIRGHDTVLRQSTRPIAPPELQEKFAADVKAYKQAVEENRRKIETIEKRVKKDFIPVEHEEFRSEMNRVALVKKRIGKTIDGKEFTQSDFDEYRKQFRLQKELRQNRPRPLESALCVTEKNAEPMETYVMVRGNANVPGDKVQPGFPSVLSPPEPEIAKPVHGKTTGRRTALANWIASKDNPLTARVMVNRIWQHHFGRGIVQSPNDFGFQGRKPTHPKLLDWLAVEFMDSDWDIKHMHRLICNSSTYKMSSQANAEMLAKDPVNGLFWRYDMRRLTAEEIRDSILYINGTLKADKMYGPSIYPTIPKEVMAGQSRPGADWHTSSPEGQARRSIYIHIKRSLPVPILASFDVAPTDTTCPVRFNTVQPTQALGMLNSEFINSEAVKFANFVRDKAGEKPSDQVQMILQRVFQRTPTAAEMDKGLEFLKAREADGLDQKKSLELYCVVALNLNEFLFLD